MFVQNILFFQIFLFLLNSPKFQSDCFYVIEKNVQKNPTNQIYDGKFSAC